MSILWSLILTLWVGAVVAATPVLNCPSSAVQFSSQQAVLNAKATVSTPAIYILHNKTQKMFWVDHRPAHPSASAGWGSQLNAGHWSAILIHQPNFNLNCIQLSDQGAQTLDCSQVLSVCAFNSSQALPPQQQGWIAENQVTLKEVLKLIPQHLAFYQS